jgi:uncharacterized protein YkwD
MMTLLRPLRVLALVILVTAGATAPTLAITASQYQPEAQECAFLKQINDYRAANGKGRLTLSKKLGAAAEHHSRDMANKNFFSHTFPDGTTWQQNIRNHGYTGNPIGENIGAGTSRDTGAEQFTAWRNSSGHNENMLRSTFQSIGIGRVFNANSRFQWYWTATFGGAATDAVAC